MLSRVANNLYWLDRYMQRSYGLLNIISTNHNSTIDSGDYSSWESIINSYMGFKSDKKIISYNDSIKVIEYMLFDYKNPNSLKNIVSKSRENARSVQEHISREVWLSTNKYFLFLNDKSTLSNFKKSDPLNFLNKLLQFNLLYYSTSDITQERGNAYCFMNVGKYFERIIQSIDFLYYKLLKLSEDEKNLQEIVFWKNLLISIGGYQLYIKRYKSIFKIENIIEMILINENFPRSVKYGVNKLKLHIKRLNTFNDLKKTDSFFLAEKLENNLKYNTNKILNTNGLRFFLDDLIKEINELSIKINQDYFS
ncbi:MAG: alpha-E domain-containing protein [Flavobacteriaceae bacterium]